MKSKTENPRVIYEFEGGPVSLFWENPAIKQFVGEDYKSDEMKKIVLDACKHHQIFVDHRITPSIDAVVWEKVELADTCEECEDCSPETCPKPIEEVGEKGSGMQLSETLEGWIIDLAKCIPWGDPVQLNAEVTRLKLQLEKVLESMNNISHCPSTVGLEDDFQDFLGCGETPNCGECWRRALEVIGESEVNP